MDELFNEALSIIHVVDHISDDEWLTKAFKIVKCQTLPRFKSFFVITYFAWNQQTDVVEWIAYLFHVQEVSGSNLQHGTVT
jgi:hypothetical protein